MHLGRSSADIGFVAFYRTTRTATEFTLGFVLHGFTNPMQHEPCGVLPDAQSFTQFVAADSVFAVCQHPQSNHPLIEAERRVLKDRSDFNRELFLALVAKPDAASPNKRVLGFAASWTGHIATGPAKTNGSVEGPLRIAKVNDGFLESFRGVHAEIVHYGHMCVKRFIALKQRMFS